MTATACMAMRPDLQYEVLESREGVLEVIVGREEVLDCLTCWLRLRWMLAGRGLYAGS